MSMRAASQQQAGVGDTATYVIIALVYAYIIGMTFILYVMLFGQSRYHRDGCIGSLNRKLSALPGRCFRFFCPCCSSCGSDEHAACETQQGEADGEHSHVQHHHSKKRVATSCFGRIRQRLCEERHPLVQLMYLGLYTTNVAAYFWNVHPRLPNVMVPQWHAYALPGIAALTLISFLAACWSDPGIITPENLKNFEHSFPVDHLMYLPDRVCRTCGTVKPARSKHCTLLNRCVSKFDHYCIWLNNDVGELNYRWFHLFLILNSLACWYGCYAMCMLIWGVVVEQNLFNAVFSMGGQRINATSGIVFQYLIMEYMLVCLQAFFLAAVGLMSAVFWLYHVYLAGTNTTTNESFKWSDMRDMYKDLKYIVKDEGQSLSEIMKDKFSDSDKYRLRYMYGLLLEDKELQYVYNKGFFANLREVVFPPSLYGGSKFSEERFLLAEQAKKEGERIIESVVQLEKPKGKQSQPPKANPGVSQQKSAQKGTESVKKRKAK